MRHMVPAAEPTPSAPFLRENPQELQLLAAPQPLTALNALLNGTASDVPPILM